ncbi:MAG: tRNA (guanosine(37)-N1)-methyltransferase TrmD [bacterium]
MNFVVITLFPEMFEGIISNSILGRAGEKNLISVDFINLRDFGLGARKQVDDTPYGGGSGMVLRVDVVEKAIESAKLKIQNTEYKILLMTPQGIRLKQDNLSEMAANNNNYIVICGHYEGFDERIRSLVDKEISIGDFVLTGGEIPAMAFIDGISRLLPGVLGSANSHVDETHSENGRIEYPQYTRPESWDGVDVPTVLLSGNHKKIQEWRDNASRVKSHKVVEK